VEPAARGELESDGKGTWTVNTGFARYAMGSRAGSPTSARARAGPRRSATSTAGPRLYRPQRANLVSGQDALRIVFDWFFATGARIARFATLRRMPA